MLDHGVSMLALDTLAPGHYVLDIDFAGDSFFAAVHTTRVVDVKWPLLGVGSLAFDEGDDGPHVIRVPVTLSEPSPVPVSAKWFTFSGTALENDDYAAAGGTVTLEPGETTATFPVTIYGDDLPEDTETLGVVIRDPENADIGTAIAELRIFTDDALYRTYEDLIYGRSEAGPLMITLRIPNGTPPWPLVVSIEAASWSFVTRHATGAEFLARRGYAVATIEFTPSTIAHWPRQLDDVRAAIAWLREHAKEFDIDRDAVGVFGIGAGGQIAAHVGLRGDAQAIVDWNGPVDFHQLDGCGSLYADVATLIGCDPASCVETVKTACPTACAAKTDVPFLILQAANDCAVPFAQGTTFAGTMRGLGADVTFFAIDDDRAAQDFALRFFDAHLRGVAVKRRATR